MTVLFGWIWWAAKWSALWLGGIFAAGFVGGAIFGQRLIRGRKGDEQKGAA